MNKQQYIKYKRYIKEAPQSIQDVYKKAKECLKEKQGINTK